MNTVQAGQGAFFGDAAIQAKYVTRARLHREADEIAQGMYVGRQDDGRPGYCAVGCLVHAGDHRLFADEMNVPPAIAHLADAIFERLPDPDFKAFPVQFIEAIPLNADLRLVTAHFLVLLLGDPELGVIRFADAQGRTVIEAVVALYRRRLAGDEPSEQEWLDAADAAARAAADAGDAAVRAAVRAAAYAAADAGDAAVRAAARAAADAADAAQAQAMRDKLLELLASAPVLEFTAN